MIELICYHAENCVLAKYLKSSNITQPTLSHHMKILCECGLVLSRKDGKNNFYRLNELEIKGFKAFLSDLFQDSDDCICK